VLEPFEKILAWWRWTSLPSEAGLLRIGFGQCAWQFELVMRFKHPSDAWARRLDNHLGILVGFQIC